MIERSGGSGSGSGSAAAAKQTLVEEGTHFKGSLASNCPVVVRGKIEGDVAAPSLNVSASGSVHGTVKVTDLRSAGELLGDFEAETVQLSGVVKDKTKLRAKSLEVRLTASTGKMQVLFGDCTLDVGEPMTKEEAIRQATQSPQTASESKAEVKEAPAVSQRPGERTSVRPSAAPKGSSDAKGSDKGDDANGAPATTAPATETSKSPPSKSP